MSRMDDFNARSWGGLGRSWRSFCLIFSLSFFTLIFHRFFIDSIENPQGGSTAAPSFLELLGLPRPPSRKTFALSRRVSASSWHISAPTSKNLSVGDPKPSKIESRGLQNRGRGLQNRAPSVQKCNLESKLLLRTLQGRPS